MQMSTGLHLSHLNGGMFQFIKQQLINNWTISSDVHGVPSIFFETATLKSSGNFRTTKKLQNQDIDTTSP